MKKEKLQFLIFIGLLINSSLASTAEHHSGHNRTAGSGGDSVKTCLKPHVSKFLPAHLATVAPGSEFSFVAFNIHKPENISATVKKIPIPLTAEYKNPFYVVKGKLPPQLKNTAARIDIKVSGKSSHCETENGWLVKIAE
jgi:hypothetical protein